MMLETLSTGLRVAVFIMMGLVHMREHLPLAVDNEPGVQGATDAKRYQRGEIWWYENRDDIALMSTKIRACELNAINATRIGRRLGCFIQRSKLRARRQLTNMAKNVAQSTVEHFHAYVEALSGPHALFAFFKLLLSMGSTILGLGKLIYHRHYLLEITKNYIEALVTYYLPLTPQPPSSVHKGTFYISEDAWEAAIRPKTKAYASPVPAVTVSDDNDSEENLEPPPVRLSPRGSPRGSPRSTGSVPLAHGGNMDEPQETAVRVSPHRQQLYRGMMVDENNAERIGALDNATARAISLYHAGGVGQDQDIFDADMNHLEAVEPLTKKRVVFKDDLVDKVEMGGRRSSPIPHRPVNPPPHEDLTPTPNSPPRLNRFLRRPAGVAVPNKRPVAR